jgi:dephospho-CoA kinase
VKLFGFTGGIGMGKSTSGRLLQERGIAVVDTDVLAHQVVEPGQPALIEIKELFGQEFVGGDGRLRRGELARKVFADPAGLRKLEAILHPRIRLLWQTQVNRWREEGRSVAAVIMPLLFETAASPHFDGVVCVACTRDSQMQRLRRRSWDAEQIQNRIRAQWPVERKLEQSNYVIWTEGGVETHAEQLGRIIP